MKKLLTVLVLLSIGSLNAQEVVMKAKPNTEDIVYVISIGDEKIEVPNSKNVLNDLDPNWIDNINVFKGNSIPVRIRTTYKDIRGVINIDLKSDKAARAFFEQLKDSLPVIVVKETGTRIETIKNMDTSQNLSIRTNSNSAIDALVRINHEGVYYILDFKEFQDINPNDIKDITVIKEKETLVKNNAEDRPGIIDIKLKNNERTDELIKRVIEKQKEKKDQN